MKKKYLGSCEDIQDRLGFNINCCDSCHEENDEGYSDLMEYEFDDGYYNCCCTVHIRATILHQSKDHQGLKNE